MSILKVTNAHYCFPDISFCGCYLGTEHLPEVVHLQKAVSKDLEEQGTPRFIVSRSREYFEEHLSAPHAIYGIMDRMGGRMAAQIIFRISDKDVSEELCVPTLPSFENGQKLSVAQGMLVHPDYRGHGLTHMLQNQWLSWCKEKRISHLSARTEARHKVSRNGFLKKGFSVIGTIVDPVDGAQVCVLHKNLRRA